MLNYTKVIITVLIITFLLIGCKDAYINQFNPMSIHQETKASSDVASMQRGENPMKRPSYEEYQESIEAINKGDKIKGKNKGDRLL